MGEIGLYWRIVVQLPENRDYKGKLYLYNPDGDLTFTCDALGRGSNTSENNYDHTAWWKTNADTPTGEWEGTVLGPGTPTSSYGPYDRIFLEAISGNGDHADIACNIYGRYGFMIHGGDPETDPSKPWYPLRPTYGCIRISNANQNTLLTKVKSYGGTGLVEVNGIQKVVS